MKKHFYFGEKVKGYSIPVFNEREVRASSGMFLFVAMMAFMNAFLIGNYLLLKIFIITFFIDFTIRLFINPKFAPSLIISRFFVANQDVEYTGAPQKKFAWSLGFALSFIMLLRVVILGLVGPVNLFICMLCLCFLFFETAFGICIGCAMYNFFKKEKAQLCPGGACKIKRKEDIQKISAVQILIAVLLLIVLYTITQFGLLEKNNSQNTNDCIVPEWAVNIGHEDLYKLHHGCE